MKNLTTWFAVFVLSTVCLLTGAYGQLTPNQDSYTKKPGTSKNYGSSGTIAVESVNELGGQYANSYIQFDLSSIPSSYTGTSVTKASLKLFVDALVTPGSFNVDFVNGSW